jgi:hypothetical protein
MTITLTPGTDLVAADGGVSEAVDVRLQDAGDTLLGNVGPDVQVLKQSANIKNDFGFESRRRRVFFVKTRQCCFWKIDLKCIVV